MRSDVFLTTPVASEHFSILSNTSEYCFCFSDTWVHVRNCCIAIFYFVFQAPEHFCCSADHTVHWSPRASQHNGVPNVFILIGSLLFAAFVVLSAVVLSVGVVVVGVVVGVGVVVVVVVVVVGVGVFCCWCRHRHHRSRHRR